jgi:ATP-binding cassette subfamily B protein
MTNYKLSDESSLKKSNLFSIIKDVNRYLGGFGKKVMLLALLALSMILITSLINVYAPNMIGEASQQAIANKDKGALLNIALWLLLLYVGSAIANYFQILVMGWIGQDILSRLRIKIFEKIQSLPLAFFNQNKSGDLISRINSDTDKLNQALSETLLRFVGNIFIIIGIGIAMVVLNPLLGAFALIVALVLITVTNSLSSIMKTINRTALNATGSLSGELQESFSNFKVIVAFNRRDYFKKAFEHVNAISRKSNIVSGIINNILTPIYDFGGNFAMFLVYFVGINLIIHHSFTLLGIQFQDELQFGTLISYVLYVDRFYSPLRIMASLFANIQTSLAAWSRISELLSLDNDLEVVDEPGTQEANSLIEFKNVSFGYEADRFVLKHVNLNIEKGKTYALVGPTGGGKSTTASLMARLYDATEGEILFHGKNIKSYGKDELSEKIGFILQEPFLFSGTIKENVLYGNRKYAHLSEEELEKLIHDKELSRLLERFPEGLKTTVSNAEDNISLGQKQLVAFLRVILREPELLILDEATANIDTVTETLLQEILDKLAADTTEIVIAHRLNTIEKADQIFFIANGEVSEPINYEKMLTLIEETKKDS